MAEYQAGDFVVVPNMASMKVLSAHEFVVFSYLCWRAGKDKLCFPSYSLMEKDTSVSKRTIIRSIQRLEELGWIKRVARTRNGGSSASNEYRIMQVNSKSKGSATESPRGARKDTGGSARKDTPLNITNKKDNQLTTTNVVKPTAGNEEINSIIKSFEATFGIEQLSGQRRAAQWLRQKYGVDVVQAMFQKVAAAQSSDQFCPRTPTVKDFYYAIPKLSDYFKRTESKKEEGLSWD